MALHFDLDVNNSGIGYFEAVRLGGDAEPDAVNTYKVLIIDQNHDTHCGLVEHRYGDGAWVLVAKAVERVMGNG